MDIVYSSTDLLNIRKTTTVNGNDCYEITGYYSVHHVFTPHSTVFIAVKHAGNIHIFNLKRDGVFPDEFTQYIDAIKSSQLEPFFNERTSVHEVFDLHKAINANNPHKFAVINEGFRCTEMMDLTNAKTKIDELNAVLKRVCPAFYLNIDYITAFPKNSDASLYYDIYVNAYICPKIILCLFTRTKKQKCVSSITFTRISDDEMSISSRTDVSYEGRKFNILLRAVAIIVSQLIMQTTQIVTSNAENVISAFIMIKWFNAVSDRVAIVPSDQLYDTLASYFTTNARLETHVHLNEDNTANATRVFHETIPRMNCKPLPRRTRRTRRSSSLRSASPFRSHPRSSRNLRHRSAPAGGKRKTMKTMKTMKTIQ
jgi:hypothetical protein